MKWNLMIERCSHIALTTILLVLVCSSTHGQLFLERIDVYAVDTIPKQSQLLPLGKRFDIICSGTFSFWKNAQGDSVGLVDAAYYRDIPPGEFGFPGLSTSTTNGFLLNGQPISTRIDPPGLSPIYRYRVPFTGQGAPVTLYIEDKPPFSVDRHEDNTGMIVVEIFDVSPEIELAPAAIDFGEVELGEARDTLIEFSNIGYGPLRVEGMRITGADAGDFAITSQSFYLLDPGEEASLTVSFIPRSIFIKNAILELNTNDSDVPLISIPLTGIGVTTLAAGVPDIVEARSQEILLLPVLLFNNREGSNTTSFYFELEYDAHHFHPLSWTNEGTLTAGMTLNVEFSAPGHITVAGNGTLPLQGTGPMLFIRGIAVWNDPSTSPLEMKSLRFNIGNPRAHALDGVLLVDSLCNQYLKSVTFSGTPQLHQNHPNPFNPSTTISFNLPSPQHIRLNVFTIDGRLVRTLLDGVLREGTYDVTFLASGLPSGTYVYTLLGDNEVLSRTMLLLR